MDFATKAYQTETPSWLWSAFTQGPADGYDRYAERLTELIAADVLENNVDGLSPEERRAAEEICAEAPALPVQPEGVE